MWPRAAMTPRRESRATASSPWSSSGARVTMRTVPSPASSSRSTSARSGARSRVGSWAPQCAALSHGPSRWMPASSPERTSGARPRTRATRRSSVSVTRLATSEVVPWARCVAMTVTASAGSPVVKAAPPPPWQCWSTKPGTRVPRRCRSAGAGGVPPPAPVTRSPLVSTQPGSTSPAGRATRSAVRITASQPFFAGSWSLRSMTSDSSPSFSRPGVCRFHLRMTHRNRK